MIVFGVILLLIIILFMMKERYQEKEKWVVYGVDSCGWTKKQIQEMDKKGVSYEYINCEHGDCPGMNAFPTLQSPSGEITEGYQTF